MDQQTNIEIISLHEEINSLRNELNDAKAILARYQSPKPESIDMKISNILIGYEIKPNLNGYRYLKEAIKMVYQNEKLLSRVTTVLYPSIADKYDDVSSCVERSIRHAIERSWFKSKHTDLGRMIEKPTNSEFIALVAERLRLENNEESA